MAHLIRGGVPRRDVMMITFTRRAASEMQKRIGALIKDIPKHGKDDAMLVGTYHALASLLIRRDAKGFGLSGSNFTTLDEDDSNSLMKSAFRECDIKPGDNVTPGQGPRRPFLRPEQAHRDRNPFQPRVPRESPAAPSPS